jgi:hypothetical protein
MKMSKHAVQLIVCQMTVLIIIALFSNSSYAEPTHIRIEAVTGIGYAVDWVTINYRDATGANQRIHRESNIALGQTADFTVPDGATDIVLEARPLGVVGSTRIFNSLRLTSGRDYCFELTGTLYHPRYASITCSWVPRGRISVFDTNLSANVGLKRVKVEVRNKSGTSTIGTTYTDDNGSFTLSRPVSGPVQYKLIFEDAAGLKVKWGANSHAESVKFESMEGPINHVIRESDRHNWYWATIYNACQFYKDYARQDGIPAKSDAQVCGYYEDGISRTPMTGVQDVIFRRYNHTSREIFGNVMHEMAHITHAQVDRAGYASFVGSWGLVNSLRAAFGESWACGPQAIYTRRRYNPTGNELGSYQDLRLSVFTYARWTIEGDHLYIEPIVVDLMDNNNQRDADNEFPVDHVSGYTLHQIASALRGAHDMDDWKNNLKRVNNPTSIYLDEYFDQYFESRAVRTSGNTIINIKAVSGIWYSVDWVEVNYTSASGSSEHIRRDRNIPLGQEATITVPDGATNIRIEAKPLGSGRNTRIFNNLSLTSGQSHCFHLKGSVNSPRYERVNCGF